MVTDSEWNQLTLLGDVGTGKSFLARMIACELGKKFLEAPLESPLPILVDLRNADRQLSLEGLILTHFANSGLSQVTFEIFQHALTEGQIVLILDGFDEMAARVTPAVTTRNFHELSRSVSGRAKVLLTCRTHYFKSRTEEEEVILGTKQDYGSPTARNLYWELIARKGFKISYLRPFEISQVEEYVRRTKPDSHKQALSKIKHTYNLMELSQRPMLLEMIVRSIDALTAQEINAATLYKVFTDAWIHRDKWRDVLSPETKFAFLTALARILWHEDLVTIHHSRLSEVLTHELATQIQNPQQFLEVDNEIRTASFLTRDESGNYGFAHRSYSEFFFARYLSQELENGRTQCLHTRRVTPEVAGFLRHMIDPTKVEPSLESILTDEYSPLVSENALVCLYSLRRFAALNDRQATTDFMVTLPELMNLKSAQLSQVTLEGAVLRNVDFSGANLSEAILSNADLTNAILNGANLEKVDLRESNLTSAVLSAAQLFSANLENAKLGGATLDGADLTETYMLGADITGVDLRNTIFPDAVLPDNLPWIDDSESIQATLQKELSSHGELTADHWLKIGNLRPHMLRAAKLAGLATGEEAKDVASEILLRILQTQDVEEFFQLSEQGQRSHIHWFAKEIVKLRERKRFPLFVDVKKVPNSIDIEDADIGDYASSIASGDASPFELVMLSEIRGLLSPEMWRAVEAFYFFGYSKKEIAREEEVSLQIVHYRLTKAREVIRKYFS